MSSRLTVSLGAVAANYRQLCDAAPGDVAAVVKADAYGLGAEPIMAHLMAQGCRACFVATAAEGAALRQAMAATAPKLSIYVLEGVRPDTRELCLRYDLIPVLSSAQQVSCWGESAGKVALQVDTGMFRLGLSPREARDVFEQGIASVDLVLNHLACADEPDHPLNQQQTAAFHHLVSELDLADRGVRVSQCNSAAVLSGLGTSLPTTEHLARAGIALFGGNPFVGQANPLLPAVRFEAQVLQVRSVPAHTGLGYGATNATSRVRQIAIVGAGYADGLPRLLSNQGAVAVGAYRCAISGRISMDLTQIDVTDTEVAVGDWVELIGTQIKLDEVAEQAQTISYEILTGLGSRAQRRYQEAQLS